MEKRSRQRELLLDILRGTTCHPDADWVFHEMRAVMPNISLGTVYRNLAKLAAEGVILKLQTGGQADRFDGRVESHYHLTCKVCGNVCDLAVPYQAALDDSVHKACGCEIDGHITIFHGKCPQCAGNL